MQQTITIRTKPTQNKIYEADFTGNKIALNSSKSYEIKLVKATIEIIPDPNFSAALGNNIIVYSPDSGVTWKNITLSDGFYSVSDLNNEIYYGLGLNGDNPTGIQFDPLLFNSKLRLLLDPTYELDVQAGQENILGFTVGIHTSTSIGSNISNFTNGLKNVLVHTDITPHSLRNSHGSYEHNRMMENGMIGSFAPTFYPYSINVVEFVTNDWIPLKHTLSTIERAKIWLTDQNNSIIQFNGDNEYIFLLRQVKIH